MTGSPAKRQGERSTISTLQRAIASGTTLAMSSSGSCISKRRCACRSRACSLDHSSSSEHCSSRSHCSSSSSSSSSRPTTPQCPAAGIDATALLTVCISLCCVALSPTGYNLQLNSVQSLAAVMTCAVMAAGRRLLEHQTPSTLNPRTPRA